MTKRKKDKRTNNDLQNTTQKNKARATRTPLKTGDEFRCSGRVSSACSINVQSLFVLLLVLDVLRAQLRGNNYFLYSLRFVLNHDLPYSS